MVPIPMSHDDVCAYCLGDERDMDQGELLSCTKCSMRLHERCAIRRRMASDYSKLEYTFDGLTCEFDHSLDTRKIYVAQVETLPIWMRLMNYEIDYAWYYEMAVMVMQMNVGGQMSIIFTLASFFHVGFVFTEGEAHFLDHWVASNLGFLLGLLITLGSVDLPFVVLAALIGEWLRMRVIDDGVSWLPVHFSLLLAVLWLNTYGIFIVEIVVVAIMMLVIFIVGGITAYRIYREFTRSLVNFDFYYTIKPAESTAPSTSA